MQSTIGRVEDIEAVEAQVRALEGRVVESQIQLEDSTLLAPYDGVIAQRFVDQGQNITPGDRVVQFQDVDEIDIAVDVPEAVMAAEIRRADIVNMTAELSAAPGIAVPRPNSRGGTGRRSCHANVQHPGRHGSAPDLRVLPGMTASVTVAYRPRRGARRTNVDPD